MCGIVGYVGGKNVEEVLLEGLKRLEYRGYDSSGIAFVVNGKIEQIKSVGRIVNLEKKLAPEYDTKVGICHTRWATHGEPTERNAHPHLSNDKKIAIVHNGIIENYQEIKEKLLKNGHKFSSDTDTEVLGHLIGDFYKGDLLCAVREALSMVRGAYGIAVVSADEPGRIVAARFGSPLILGIGEGENFVASDVSAFLGHTKNVVYLNDGELVDLRENTYSIYDLNNNRLSCKVSKVEWSLEESEKGGYDHFMLKEIMEQPEVIKNSTRGRILFSEGDVRLGGLEQVSEKLGAIKRIIIVACGTARYAALVGEYLIEEYSGIPVEVEYASEFRYREPLIDESTAVLAVSQSGETVDTLAAIREAKKKGALTLGIVNVVGSTIARETDAGIYNHAGPEIAVASTKAFTSQVVVLTLLAVMLGRQRNMSVSRGQDVLKSLLDLPKKITEILDHRESLRLLAEKYKDFKHFMYLGRKYCFPLAEEGALKLKEISYIHAEGYASGEMKHGPIALIDENFPTFAIIPRDSVYEKGVSNLAEIKARKGKVIALTTVGSSEVSGVADDIFEIPETIEPLVPILAVAPLQLFAYYVAVTKKLDVDKPRNLAKSVTVE
jgi:glucosamine--fructose-6-phosphate aminotransferase (isomerizing)